MSRYGLIQREGQELPAPLYDQAWTAEQLRIAAQNYAENRPSIGPDGVPSYLRRQPEGGSDPGQITSGGLSLGAAPPFAGLSQTLGERFIGANRQVKEPGSLSGMWGGGGAGDPAAATPGYEVVDPNALAPGQGGNPETAMLGELLREAIGRMGSNQYPRPEAGPVEAMPENMDPSFLDNLSPEDIQAIMQMQGVDESLLPLNEEMALAAGYRDTALPEGRTAGRVFVAANPLEFAGSLMKQYKGGKAYKEASGKRDEVLEDLKSSRGRITEAILNNMGGGKPRSLSESEAWGGGW